MTSNETPKVYLASGWFNEAQRNQMEEIHAVLEKLRDEGAISFFAPFYDGIVLKGKENGSESSDAGVNVSAPEGNGG